MNISTNAAIGRRRKASILIVLSALFLAGTPWGELSPIASAEPSSPSPSASASPASAPSSQSGAVLNAAPVSAAASLERVGPGGMGGPQVYGPGETPPQWGYQYPPQYYYSDTALPPPVAPPQQGQDSGYIPPLPPAIMSRAFVGAEQNMYPLSPQQIKSFNEYVNSRARAADPTKPIKGQSRLVEASMEPGMPAIKIQCAPNYVTALVFRDSNGYAWPVASVAGAGEAYENKIESTGKRNIVTLTPKTLYGNGDLIVNLDGADQPIAFLLETDHNAADFRVEIRVVGRSPIAPNLPSRISGLPQLTDEALRQAVQGLTPAGAERVKIENAPGEAWLAGGTLFVRTPWVLLWPAYDSSVALYGYNAYEVKLASAVALPTAALFSDPETGESHKAVIKHE